MVYRTEDQALLSDPALLDDALLRPAITRESHKVLPPAVLLSRLGEGAMGTVYLGYHLNFKRPVAVKCLKPEMARVASIVDRFEREARIANDCVHPNLVRVHDTCREADPPYTVMEYVDGENLTERVERTGRAFSAQAALTVFCRALDGLGALHEKGITHRDVKPDNLMIARDGTVKVADLGVAKAGAGFDVLRTATGVQIGTPQYMAPEQIDGARDVGAKSDLYAAAATLAYLLLGRAAVRGETTMAIFRQLAQHGFPRLDAQLPGAPRDLTDLIAGCTRPVMNDRFTVAEARALAADLLEQRGGFATLEPPPSWADGDTPATLVGDTLVRAPSNATTLEPETIDTIRRKTYARPSGASTRMGSAEGFADERRSPGKTFAVVAGAAATLAAGGFGLWQLSAADAQAEMVPNGTMSASLDDAQQARLSSTPREPIASIAAERPAVQESPGGSEAGFVITLDRPADRELDIFVATVANAGRADRPDARPGVDYRQLVDHAVRFAPGQTRQTVRVPVLDDTAHEADAWLAADLRRVSGYGVDGANGRAWVKLLDDDPPPAIVTSDSLAANVREAASAGDWAEAVSGLHALLDAPDRGLGFAEFQRLANETLGRLRDATDDPKQVLRNDPALSERLRTIARRGESSVAALLWIEATMRYGDDEWMPRRMKDSSLDDAYADVINLAMVAVAPPDPQPAAYRYLADVYLSHPKFKDFPRAAIAHRDGARAGDSETVARAAKFDLTELSQKISGGNVLESDYLEPLAGLHASVYAMSPPSGFGAYWYAKTLSDLPESLALRHARRVFPDAPESAPFHGLSREAFALDLYRLAASRGYAPAERMLKELGAAGGPAAP